MLVSCFWMLDDTRCKPAACGVSVLRLSSIKKPETMIAKLRPKDAVKPGRFEAKLR